MARRWSDRNRSTWTAVALGLDPRARATTEQADPPRSSATPLRMGVQAMRKVQLHGPLNMQALWKTANNWASRSSVRSKSHAATLLLRYCAARFAHSTPTWRLPVSGQVRRLIAAYPESAGDSGNPGLVHGVPLVSGSSSFRKRFRLNRKTPAHLVGISAHSRPRVWKRLRQVGYSDFTMPDHCRGIISYTSYSRTNDYVKLWLRHFVHLYAQQHHA